MADLTAITNSVAALNAKLDALLAKPVPTPVDDQPAIDALAAQVDAITAKIPD